MASGTKKYPDFFKVYLPQEHSQRMLIPNAFVNLMTYLQERLPEEVILRDHRSGRDWHVNARLIGGKLYFDGGWKKFRNENLLKAADFLVFTYDGTNLFKFKLYDESGCENIKEDEEYGNEIDSVMELEKMKIVEDKVKGKGKLIEMSEEEEDDDEDYEMEEEEEEETEDDYYDYGDEDRDDSENEEDTEMEENTRSHCRASKDPINSKRGAARSSATKDKEFEDYEADAEMCVHPDNPYFVAKVLKGRSNELHIPHAVIQDYSLSFSKEITLLCCKCQDVPRNEARAYHLSLPQQTLNRQKRLEGTGQFRKWEDGRVWLLGWASFSRKNKIKENNVCICEIVLEENQMIKMLRVHVR